MEADHKGGRRCTRSSRSYAVRKLPPLLQPLHMLRPAAESRPSAKGPLVTFRMERCREGASRKIIRPYSSCGRSLGQSRPRKTHMGHSQFDDVRNVPTSPLRGRQKTVRFSAGSLDSCHLRQRLSGDGHVMLPPMRISFLLQEIADCAGLGPSRAEDRLCRAPR